MRRRAASTNPPTHNAPPAPTISDITAHVFDNIQLSHIHLHNDGRYQIEEREIPAFLAYAASQNPPLIPARLAQSIASDFPRIRPSGQGYVHDNPLTPEEKAAFLARLPEIITSSQQSRSTAAAQQQTGMDAELRTMLGLGGSPFGLLMGFGPVGNRSTATPQAAPSQANNPSVSSVDEIARTSVGRDFLLSLMLAGHLIRHHADSHTHQSARAPGDREDRSPAAIRARGRQSRDNRDASPARRGEVEHKRDRSRER